MIVSHSDTSPTDRPATPLLLNVKQTAELAGMSIRWIWRATSAGEFPLAIKIGRATRWRRCEVEEWVEDLAQ